MKTIIVPDITAGLELEDKTIVQETLFVRLARMLLSMPVDEFSEYRVIVKILDYLDANRDSLMLKLEDAWYEILVKRAKRSTTEKRLPVSSIEFAKYFVIPLEDAKE